MTLLANRSFRALRAAPPLRALPVLLLLATASPAGAESLEVDVATDLALDANQVKSVIAAELGASIVDDGADLGTVVIHLDGSKRLVVEHRQTAACSCASSHSRDCQPIGSP